MFWLLVAETHLELSFYFKLNDSSLRAAGKILYVMCGSDGLLVIFMTNTEQQNGVDTVSNMLCCF